VTPPASSIEPVWEVRDFGAVDATTVPAPKHSPPPPRQPAVPAPAANQRTVAVPAGSQHHHPKPQHKHSGKPPARPAPKPAVPEQPAPDIAGDTPLRVPFGRGPKDKAFREQQAAEAREKKRGRRR
jgi:hypothetical protein